MLHRKEDRRQILQYVLPSISAMVVSCTYNVVDGMFVGQGVGESALAAVNLTVPFTEITTALASMLTVGGGTIMSIRKGRGDNEGANKAFMTSVSLVSIIGIFMLLVGTIFPVQLARIFGAPRSLEGLTVDYLRWYSLFSIFFTVAILGSVYVRNDGSPSLSFWGMVAGAVSNIFLDWLFVFPFGWGIIGAAVASGLGQLVACAVLSIHFIQKRGILRFQKPQFEKTLLKKVCTRGLPEFVIQMSQPITIFCYNRAIIRHLGEENLAAFSACTYLLIIVFGVYMGVCQGIQPLIGNSFGTQNKEDMKYFFQAGLKLSGGITAVIYALYFALGPVLLTLFIKEDSLIPVACDALQVYGASTILAALNIIYIYFFLSTKNTKPAMELAVCRGVILNSLCIFIIPAVFGKGSIWFPVIVAEAITLVIAVIMKSRYEKKSALSSEKTYS